MHTTLKTRSRHARLAQACLLLLALCSIDVTARGDNTSQADAQRWYQIEVILFANRMQNSGDEIWRQDPQLDYPYNWVVLKDPSKAAEVGDTDTWEGLEQWEMPALESMTDVPATIPASNAPTPESELIDLDRHPFYILPAEQRQLQREARSLQRSPLYRVLMHEAWRQPVLDEAKAPFVLIAAGDPHGNHRELEGSLSISVSRYLHLRTDLWFTQFVHNYGQEQASRPELPQRPDERDYHLEAGQSGTVWRDVVNLDRSYDQVLSRPYIADRISRISQRRRMRSGEIHYIDHPHVGIIVLCTPYELPPPATPSPQTETLQLQQPQATEAGGI